MATTRDTLFKDMYEATKKMHVADASAYFRNAQDRHPELRNTALETFAEYWLHADAQERSPRTFCPLPILPLLNSTNAFINDHILTIYIEKLDI